MIKKEIIKAYALENAIKYKGKANHGAVINSLFAEGLKKDKIKDILPKVKEVLDEINSMSLKEQEKAFEKLEETTSKRKVREEGELPELPNAKQGEVVMRMAPFPSGPMHIGNTRQLILNDEYVKKYNGKLVLVIDDTIGSEQKPILEEAYDMIPEGANWLGVKYDKKIIYKSDRLETYYAYAQELIKKGYMYVCSCQQEEIRELREKGIECGCRNLPSYQHEKRWKEMFKAKPGQYTVRLKTSMQDSDPAFRDRVMFRISDRKHPRVGKKYSVWPLLEFSWAIDDHLLGMTHIIRGIELQMETKIEKFIWDIFKWKHPEVIHTGLFQIEGIKLSKSKGAKEVKSGEYEGWNDPRLWSLQSLKDRGIKPQAIRDFILNMGITKSNSTVAIDVLYALNRKYLEKVPRYFFVPEPEKITIKGCPEIETQIPLHPEENLGTREYFTIQDFYIPGEDAQLMLDKQNYRLMHLLTFEIDHPSPLSPKEYRFISQEPQKNVKSKFIQWIPADPDNDKKKISIQVRMPDNSIIKGYGEPALAKLKSGTSCQFERFGFVRHHKSDSKNKIAEFWFAHR